MIEHANYVGNFNKHNNPHSNKYNLGWRNHPNFSWSNNQNVMRPPNNPSQEKKSPLEEALMQLTTNTNNFMTEMRTSLQNQNASIQNLEVQISQLANQLNGRPQGNLPSTTEVNPIEHCKAITLKSGKELFEPIKKEKIVKENREALPTSVPANKKTIEELKSQLLPPSKVVPNISYPQ